MNKFFIIHFSFPHNFCGGLINLVRRITNPEDALIKNPEGIIHVEGTCVYCEKDFKEYVRIIDLIKECVVLDKKFNNVPRIPHPFEIN